MLRYVETVADACWEFLSQHLTWESSLVYCLLQLTGSDLIYRILFTGSGLQDLVYRIWFTGSCLLDLVYWILFTGSCLLDLVY